MDNSINRTSNKTNWTWQYTKEKENADLQRAKQIIGFPLGAP